MAQPKEYFKTNQEYHEVIKDYSRQTNFFKKSEIERLNFLYLKAKKNLTLDQNFARLERFRREVIEDKITALVETGKLREEVVETLGFRKLFDEKTRQQKWFLKEDSPVFKAIENGYTGAELQKFIFDDNNAIGLNLNFFPDYKLLNEYDIVRDGIAGNSLSEEFKIVFEELNKFEKTALRKDKSSKILHLLESEAGQIQLSHINALIASHFNGIVSPEYQEKLKEMKQKYNEKSLRCITSEMSNRVFRNWVTDVDNFNMIFNNKKMEKYIDLDNLIELTKSKILSFLSNENLTPAILQEWDIKNRNEIETFKKQIEQQLSTREGFLEHLRKNDKSWRRFYKTIFDDQIFQKVLLKPEYHSQIKSFDELLELTKIKEKLQKDFELNHRLFNNVIERNRFLTRENATIIGSNPQYKNLRNNVFKIYDAFNTTRPRTEQEKQQAIEFNKKYGEAIKNVDFLDADDLIAEMSTSYAEICDAAFVNYNTNSLKEVRLTSKGSEKEFKQSIEEGAFGSYLFKPFKSDDSLFSQYLNLHDQLVQYTLSNASTYDLLLIFETFSLNQTQQEKLKVLKKKFELNQPFNDEDKTFYKSLVEIFVREGLLDPYNEHSYENLQSFYLGEYAKDSRGFYQKINPSVFKFKNRSGKVEEFKLNVRDTLPPTNSETWFKENLQDKQEKMLVYSSVLQNLYEDELFGKEKYKEKDQEFKQQMQKYLRDSSDAARTRYFFYFMVHRLATNRAMALGGMLFFPGFLPLILLASPAMCFIDRLFVKGRHKKLDRQQQAELEQIKKTHFHTENLWKTFNTAMLKDNEHNKLSIDHLIAQANKNTNDLDFDTFLPNFQTGEDNLVLENLYNLRNAQDIQNIKSKTLMNQLAGSTDEAFNILNNNKSDYPDLTLSIARDMSSKIKLSNFITLPPNTFKDKEGYRIFLSLLSPSTDKRKTQYFLHDIFNLETFKENLLQAGLITPQDNFDELLVKLNDIDHFKMFFSNNMSLKKQTTPTAWFNNSLHIDPTILNQMETFSTEELENYVKKTIPDFMFSSFEGAQVPSQKISTLDPKTGQTHIIDFASNYQLRFDYNEYCFKAKMYYEQLRKKFGNKRFGGFSEAFLKDIDKQINRLTTHNQIWNDYAQLIKYQDPSKPIDFFSESVFQTDENGNFVLDKNGNKILLQKGNEQILEMLSQTTSSIFSKTNPHFYKDQSFLESFLTINKELLNTTFNSKESFIANYLDAVSVNRIKINKETFEVFAKTYNADSKEKITWEEFKNYMNEVLNSKALIFLQKSIARPMSANAFKKPTNIYDMSEMTGFRAERNIQAKNEKWMTAARHIDEKEYRAIIQEQFVKYKTQTNKEKLTNEDFEIIERNAQEIIKQKIAQNQNLPDFNNPIKSSQIFVNQQIKKER